MSTVLWLHCAAFPSPKARSIQPPSRQPNEGNPGSTMNSLTPLIEMRRGATLENLHLGAVAHVNASGQVLSAAGDPHWLSFTRSTLKALQALPFVQGGGLRQFAFNTVQTALLCASHNGEAAHVAQVDGMLAATQLPHTALRCGCHVPGLFSYLDAAPPPDLAFDERHNNCSGKHAGMLAYCVQHGLTLENYTEPDHPLQVAIRRDVASACGIAESAMPMGIDGCSAPNYAMPLAHLATGFARVASACAQGRGVGVPGAVTTAFDASFATLGEAMVAHPEMVSGQGRNDLALIRAGRGDWIAKVGADGVQVLASIQRGEAFALKVIDANKVAAMAATVAVLDQLGWMDDAQRAELAPWRASVLRNARGLEVGERRAVLRMTRPAA